MDTKDHHVISVLSDQRRFVVPIYQRQYSWGEARLKPFWADVATKAEEALTGKPKFSHYMGALILAPGGDGFTIGATPRVQVVDGQQRLTTFQIFLAALRDICEKFEENDLKSMINNYLFVPTMHGDTDPDARFRLIPTREDRAVFQLIVEKGMLGIKQKYPDYFFLNGKIGKSPVPNAVSALWFFADHIDNFCRFGIVDDDADDAPTTPEPAESHPKRLRALLEALLNHLKLVVITLDENDDAQVIFETLNSQAEPLLAMDLVRNNIFHRAAASGESVEALFESRWRQFDQDGEFWKADSPRAKPKRPRIDHFLSHALSSQTGEEISLRELYAEYRSFTRPKGKLRFNTVEAELDALISHVPTYRALEVGKGDIDLNWLGQKLNLWEVSTAYPLVFRIAQSAANQLEKKKMYRLIYSYLVRRTLCGLTPKGLNKIFVRIIATMMRSDVSVTSLLGALAGERGDTVRFPSDPELKQAIKTRPIYNMLQRKDRLADLLWDLETESRTKYSVDTSRPDELSVEHVMPQSWAMNWPLPDGRFAPPNINLGADSIMQEHIRKREILIQTFGNLTLITIPANSTASNKAFSGKKQWLQGSLLALNLPIVQRDHWDEGAIEERSAVLADLAVKVWPGLDYS